MDDDFNILGNFENLSSVNIVKKLTLPATNSQISKSATEEDYDLLLDIEKTIGHEKRGKKTSNKTTAGKLLQNSNSINLDSTEENSNHAANSSRLETEPCVGRRTRSSKGKVSEPQHSSGSKRKVTNKRKTNKNASQNLNSSANQTISDDGLDIRSTTRSGRGRKRISISSNASGSSLDSTERLDDMLANEPQCSADTELAPRSRLRSGQTRNVMRARRNYLAERAARCTTVEIVDLITSPIPLIKGVINVDDDDDTAQMPSSLDASFDAENPEVSVKIVWNGSPEVFLLRTYQKFDHIFEKLAERESIGKDKILLNLDNKIISPNDTPASINYKIFQFIYGRAMADTKFGGVSAAGKKKRDPNLLVLKVQSDKWKHPISLELLKTETFKKLIIKCAEELKMPYEKVKLSFDGEPLQNDQTPIDLEFEGGEVLEIHLKDKA